jgi:hypothetical protein
MLARYGEYGVRSWVSYRLPVRCYVLLLTKRGLPKGLRTQGVIDAGDIQVESCGKDASQTRRQTIP